MVDVGCSFDELTHAAAGYEPYDYQRRMAVEGLPELLHVPTGAGKTLAATLPWLYRRRLHPDDAVRAATPRRLVVVLPQRALVEQTERVVRTWLANAEVDVPVHVLLGGASTDDRHWKLDPAADAIFVGTQDMVLSRLLLRGYGETLGARPMSFGLLHAGTQFVFDEIQLMGPGLPTSLQLEGLRRILGTADPCSSMWTSATVDRSALSTIDFSGPATSIEIMDADRTGPLARRLQATRVVTGLDITDSVKFYPGELAEEVLDRHKPGTRTLVVINTVERAQAVYDELVSAESEAKVLLLHSRFRPPDRARRTEEVLHTEDAIVVATQVLEAGIDLTSNLLVTELAPWSSIVQRAGRCNRDGNAAGAVLAWVWPPGSGPKSAAPYDEADLEESEAALDRLEGAAVTSGYLIAQPVNEQQPVHSVLRRRDLIGLFDTTPDLAGNDLDVGRWIRDADETTVYVAWRAEPPTTGTEQSEPLPDREDLCPVPIGGMSDWVKKKRLAWRYDQTAASWAPVKSGVDVRPGAIYRLLTADGGYTADRGWSPGSKQPVPPLDRTIQPTEDHQEVPDGVGDDPGAQCPRPVLLVEHLDDVGRDVRTLLGTIATLHGLTARHYQAAALAGHYHDLGKAHPVFQESLRKAAGESLGDGLWAKSNTNRRLYHRRRYFRHELASALMLLDGAGHLLADADDPDLVTYLVAAHHGKVRMTVRSMPDEDGGTVLGVGHSEDEPTAPLTLTTGESVPPVQVRLDRIRIGSEGDRPSWSALAAGLRDRPDLGPFRLGFLEAVVRVADQRVSAGYRSVKEAA